MSRVGGINMVVSQKRESDGHVPRRTELSSTETLPSEPLTERVSEIVRRPEQLVLVGVARGAVEAALQQHAVRPGVVGVPWSEIIGDEGIEDPVPECNQVGGVVVLLFVLNYATTAGASLGTSAGGR